ncbi:MAG: hypothetical protein CMJ19_11260 [Phycisphaeraceae bacterium]|nr:hypothetical protein [Phycisphaeraceae bacterium]
MDSKHRHELEQNDLVVFLTGFNEWWNKYGQVTLILVVIVLGSFTAVRFYNHNKQQAHESAWGALAQSTSPESYSATASENAGAVKALAYLRGADLLLEEATLPAKPEDQEVTPTPAAEGETAEDAPKTQVQVAAPQKQDPAQMLEDALTMYQAVAKDKKVHAVLRINGLLGVACVAEAQGKWDLAAESYDQAIVLAGTKYDVLAQQATGRKAKLEDLKTPVKFAKAAPAPAPVMVQPKADEPKAPTLDLDLSKPPVLPGVTDESADQ